MPFSCRTALLSAAALAFALTAAAAVPVDGPVLDPAGRQDLPHIARGSDGYLAVWRDFRGNGDTYAARISSSGAILDPLGIHISSGQALTAVTAVPDGYLLVSGTGCGSIDSTFIDNYGHVAPTTHVADWAGLCIGDVELATNGETVLADWDGKGALLDTHGQVLRGSLDFGQAWTRSAVASNGSDYLVANVSENSSIYVVPVSRNGDLSSRQTIGPLSGEDTIAIASDGSNYLVAVAGATVALQRVAPTGLTAGAIHTIGGTFASVSPRLAWNGAEFALMYTVAPHTYFARVQQDGTPTLPLLDGPPVEQPQFPPYDLAPSSDGFFFVSAGDHAILKGTFVRDADWRSGAFPPMSPLSRAAHSQWLGAVSVVGDRLVAVWREWWATGPAFIRARAFTSDGVPLTPVVDVASSSLGEAVHFAVAFDGKYVVIAWADNTAHFRRFTLGLDPVDAQSIELAQQVSGLSLAAANGTCLAAWLSNDRGFNRGVAAATIDTENVIPTVHNIALPSPRFYDGLPVVTWNTTDFAVIWPTSTGPWPSQALFPYPPDDIVGMRVSAGGSLIDTAPTLIAHANSATEVFVAANTSTRYVVWGDAHLSGVPIDDSLNPLHTPLILSGDRYIEAVTVAPHGAGFVVGWRSSGAAFDYTQSTSLLTLDGGGNPTGSGQLQPEDVSYAGSAIAVRTMGGKLILADDAISYGEPFGGVSRVFLETAQIVPQRRRAVGRR